MIKTLLTADRSERDSFSIPRSVQESIPVKRVYRDGVWLAGRKHSRTWRLGDVNYQSASEEDQRAIFLAYCGVINSLPTDATAKITLFNPPVGASADGGGENCPSILAETGRRSAHCAASSGCASRRALRR